MPRIAMGFEPVRAQLHPANDGKSERQFERISATYSIPRPARQNRRRTQLHLHHSFQDRARTSNKHPPLQTHSGTLGAPAGQNFDTNVMSLTTGALLELYSASFASLCRLKLVE
jgi:hypothetical protein